MWSEADYTNLIQTLKLECTGLAHIVPQLLTSMPEEVVTESQFVQVFEERLPADAATFADILSQLEVTWLGCLISQVFCIPTRLRQSIFAIGRLSRS